MDLFYYILIFVILAFSFWLFTRLTDMYEKQRKNLARINELELGLRLSMDFNKTLLKENLDKVKEIVSIIEMLEETKRRRDVVYNRQRNKIHSQKKRITCLTLGITLFISEKERKKYYSGVAHLQKAAIKRLLKIKKDLQKRRK